MRRVILTIVAVLTLIGCSPEEQVTTNQVEPTTSDLQGILYNYKTEWITSNGDGDTITQTLFKTACPSQWDFNTNTYRVTITNYREQSSGHCMISESLTYNFSLSTQTVTIGEYTYLFEVDDRMRIVLKKYYASDKYLKFYFE